MNSTLPTTITIKRCAVYTRKSSEEGLDQEFNSLDAQRESGEAYVKSQRHEGWELLGNRYDDGGISGGTMKRPGLSQLLADVEAGLVDIIVVYKVDRLSRSLGDFGRMVELFDLHKVSFVSVTQQFNTTTSMGRLTLNILLSFSQFEREVTSERIRDKIAMSKKRGMWMGGNVPLGYDAVDRKLITNEPEADTIKLIFHDFNRLKSVTDVAHKLTSEGYRTKPRQRRNTPPSNGVPFSKTAIYKILNNPLYIGKVRHKDKTYEGLHDALIEQPTWDSAQAIMATNRHVRAATTRRKTAAPLKGLLFGPDGYAMTPTQSMRRGKHYRYYITHTAAKHRHEDCDMALVRAGDIEGIVFDQLKRLFSEPAILVRTISATNDYLGKESRCTSQEMLRTLQSIAPIWDYLYHKEQARMLDIFIDKIQITDKGVHIDLRSNGLVGFVMDLQEHTPEIDPDRETGNLEELDNQPNLIESNQKPVVFKLSNNSEVIHLFIESSLGRKSARKTIISPEGKPINKDRNYEADAKLLNALIKAHRWQRGLAKGKYKDIKDIAMQEDINSSVYVSRVIRLSLLAPDIQEAILNQLHSNDLMLSQFMTPFPIDWDEQRRLFGGTA